VTGGRGAPFEHDEAYRRLRRYASDHNLRLAEVGDTVLKSDEIFQALERAPAGGQHGKP
jgi:hypothetical protein